MSSASNIDVAMRFTRALADRLLESHDIDVVTARLKRRLQVAPEREHRLLMDVLVALEEQKGRGRPEARAVSRH